MKIAVISTDSHRLHGYAGVLDAYQVSQFEGGLDRLQAIAGQDAPDLIVVDAINDAIDLGQVELVTASFPQIAVLLVCPTPCADFLLGAMRAGVRDVLPATAPPAVLLESVRRIAARSMRRETAGMGKVLAFLSCKGGCGATFIATNLGYQLAQNKTVLLIDLNLQFGDALSCLHDENPVATIADLARDIRRLDASLLATSAIEVAPNYFILPAPEAPEQASDISAAHVDAILAVALAQYDFVLLDMGRALDAASIKALDRADRIYTVMQADLPCVRNALKLQAAFQALGYASDKLEWIVNQFDGGSGIGLDDMRHKLATERVRVIGRASKQVTRSRNLGRPLAQAAQHHPVTRNLAELMQSIDPAASVRRGFFERLFKRV